MTVRVLVVEDDAIAAAAHTDYVGRVPGFVVAGTARTAQEAVRLLRTGTGVDLILLDMNLPDGHGLEILRSLRAAGHGCDVIAVTAARDAAVVRRAVTQGVAGYLLKPFTFAAFRARLEQYAEYRSTLTGEGDIDQDHLDGLFAARRPSTPATPKGLSPESLAQVETLLRGTAGALSAGEVATEVGMSRVTARRYLEYLAEGGVAHRGVRYGGRGRPEVEYSPAPRR
ncbi:MAG: response regulator [Mobilicoccus sp.]|nr:response regulator [Mobilicoccus sp.]